VLQFTPRHCSGMGSDGMPLPPATSVCFFLHGLGDTASSFAGMFHQLAIRMPHVKFLLPTAKNMNVTVNQGMSHSACKLRCRQPRATRQHLLRYSCTCTRTTQGRRCPVGTICRASQREQQNPAPALRLHVRCSII